MCFTFYINKSGVPGHELLLRCGNFACEKLHAGLALYVGAGIFFDESQGSAEV